jgi:hypothetical protein
MCRTIKLPVLNICTVVYIKTFTRNLINFVYLLTYLLTYSMVQDII